MELQVISAESWMSLAGKSGVFEPDRFGFTPRAETYVWAQRTLKSHIIYFCMLNGFDVIFHDTTVRVGKASMIWIMPGVPHETRLLAPRRGFQCYFLRFRMLAEDQRALVRLERDFIARDDAWHLLPHVREIVHELQSPQPFHEQRLRGNLLLLSAGALSPEVTHRNVLSAQQRAGLLRHIEIHINGKITTQALADEVGLSMRYFRRIFHRSFGMSPKQWLVRQRIIVAATMMSGSELTSKEIARRLGYCDQALFSRQFKQVMGIRPRTFRSGAGPEPVWAHMEDDMNGAIWRHRLELTRRR